MRPKLNTRASIGANVVVALCLGLLSTGVVAQTPDEPVIGVQKTGQTKCWDSAGDEISCANTGQDGETQNGVTAPSPRCTNNGDGTITDHMSGLVWLANNSCFSDATWAAQLQNVDALAEGGCGLTDGSTPGEWRAPNLNEMISALTFGSDGSNDFAFDCGLTLTGSGLFSSSILPGHRGFVDSTTPLNNSGDGSRAYSLSTSNGGISSTSRRPTDTGTNVWPVRGASTRDNAVVPVLTTGQVKCWSDELDATTSDHEIASCIGTGADGELQAGIQRPVPRFRSLQDRVVQDRVTGLIWLDTSTCFAPRSWTDSLGVANGLFDGADTDDLDGDCGLTDGSQAGDWRLPSATEALSLLELSEQRYNTQDLEFDGMTVTEEAIRQFNGAGMPGVTYFDPDGFWTSTTIFTNRSWAYKIGENSVANVLSFAPKTDDGLILLVRDP